MVCQICQLEAKYMILTVYNDICLVCEADKDKMILCLRASRVGFYVIPIL